MSELDEDHFNTHLKVMREVSSEAGEFLRLLRSMNYLLLPQFQANAYQQFFIFTEDEAAWAGFKAGFNTSEFGVSDEGIGTETETVDEEGEAPGPDIIDNIPGIEKLYPNQPERRMPPEMDDPTEDIPDEAPESDEQEEEQVVADTPTPESETVVSMERDNEPEAPTEPEDGADLYRQQKQDDEGKEPATPAPPFPREPSEEEASETKVHDHGYIEHALSLLNAGQVEEGLQHMASAIGDQPDNAVLRYHYALMLARSRKDYHSAREELLPVIELDPENTDALFLIGELEELEGNFDAAREHYHMLLNVDENYPNAYYRLGMITAAHFESERADAAKYFKKAVKRDKSNFDAFYQYALLLNEVLGKPEKAIKYFKKTLKINAFHPFAYYDMALVYHQLGEYSKAADAYQKAIQINPELQTAENDEAFAVDTAQLEAQPELRNTPGAPPAVDMGAIEALKDSIVGLEQLLRDKEETVKELQQKLEERPAAPPPPPRPEGRSDGADHRGYIRYWQSNGGPLCRKRLPRYYHRATARAPGCVPCPAGRSVRSGSNAAAI